MEYRWIHCSAYSSLPPNAIVGGNDTDGSMIYVGRSFHNGDMLVAKVIPSKHKAYVSWRGLEISKDHFEILCGQRLVWRHCYDHIVPENAVLCGRTALDQPVYIGRGHFEGSLTVGKVSSVHRALFIPFNGIERRLETYEILIEENRSHGWSVTPSPPVTEKPYPPLDVKPYPSLDMKPYPPPLDEKPYPPLDASPYLPPYPPPPPPFGPSAPFVPVPRFDPPPPYAPLPPMPTVPSMPPMHLPPVHTPPQIRSHDMWIASTSSYIPPGAVHAGHDTDLSPIFVCRAFHQSDLVPGKAVSNRSCAFISFAGQEIPKTNIEVLIGENKYHWVHAQDGRVVPGAVKAGRTASGESLFVGRAHYCGSLTPGKIQPSHHCLYIAFGGSERRITSYEVLVHKEDFYRGQAMRIHY